MRYALTNHLHFQTFVDLLFEGAFDVLFVGFPPV